MARVKAAIIGSGNIGTDLMMKMIKYPQNMELVAVVGIDASSEGLAKAREHGIATTHEGIEGHRSTRTSASRSTRPVPMLTRSTTRLCAPTASWWSI
jgi:acetaldehyde dehydrogenase (acetylating)